MRSSSATKRRQEYDKYIESRVLITSNSLNPLSKHISTKLDLIKQEISREFHEKFPSDKKRTMSGKKSSSKTKLPEAKDIGSVSKKLNYNITGGTPSHGKERSSLNVNTEHQSQNQTYRQKFYELQDKFMEERKKMIDDFQKSSTLRQKIMDFLEEPSVKTAEQLSDFFPSDRQKKIIDKFVSMSEDVDYAEKTLSQLLTIVEVEDIETLLSELRSRQQGYKNLSECSFKILELETAYNRLQRQSQQKMKELETRSSLREQQIKNELNLKMQNVEGMMEAARKQEKDSIRLQINDLLHKIGRVVSNGEEDGDGDQVRNSLMFITFEKIGAKQHRNQKSEASIAEEEKESISSLLDRILNYLIEMKSSVDEIQRQAQQNIAKLEMSRHDLDRLEKLIESVTYQTEEEKNRLIEHFEDIADEKDRQHLQERQKLQAMLEEQREKNRKGMTGHEEKDKELEELAVANQKLAQHVEKKQQILLRIIRIICDTTGQDVAIFGIELNERDSRVSQGSEPQPSVEEITINKIEVILKKHLLSLKENLQAADNMIMWHEKELEIKEGLLKEFEFNLKKLLEDAEAAMDRERKLSFERDEYKYLLNNLRENVREMKVEHEQQLAKLERKKDEEYLHSSRDILTDNKRLNDQIAKLQSTIAQLSSSLASQSASHQFHSKKSQQFESIIIELRKKLLVSQSQSNRYKQHLTEIESSFKEVENMSEMNSHKMIGLEEENKLISRETAQLREKVHQLMADIQVKDDRFNKLKYAYEELEKRYTVQGKNKEDVEAENSQIRLHNLEVQEQLRGQQERAKKIAYQNANLTRENKKLMEEVNAMTRKLLGYVGQKSIANRNKKEMREQVQQEIQEELKKLKGIQMNTQVLVRDQLEEFRTAFQEECEQVAGYVKDYAGYLAKKDLRRVKEKQEDADEASVEECQNRNTMRIANQKLAYTKEQLNNLRDYCKYIHKQFEGQLKYVSKMMGKPEQVLARQSASISNNWDTLMKVNLMLNSLRNQSEEIRETLQVDRRLFALMISELQARLNQKAQQQQEPLLVPLQTQELNKYLQPSSPAQQQPQASEEEYMSSPQFPKVRQHPIYEQVDKEDENIEIASIEDRNKENNENNEREININSERTGKVKNYSFKMSSSELQEQDNKEKEEDELQKLRWSELSMEKDEAQRVRKILISLKDNESEQPKVPYFQLIKTEYRILKKRLLARSLALDISAVSFRHNTLSSPSSVSFSKDFLFDKRVNTEPNEQLPLAARETNRSEYKFDANEPTRLVKENEELLKRVQHLGQELSLCWAREEEYKIRISELDKQKTELENEASKEMKQKLFIKFITDLCRENWKEVENSCKIILKLLGMANHEIGDRMDALRTFISKHEKKGTGFMGGLFQKGKG